MTAGSGRPLTIAMVAGEASGDNLGAALAREIKRVHPDASLFGIAGPAMMAEGVESEFDIETLSVNGIVDPLLRLPSLIQLLTGIRDLIISRQVDCFVGIDSNFFNLLLAGMLKKHGVTTVQYVSPTVWAWRRGRIHTIAKKIDLMLTLYPFETAIYEQHGVPVAFVGHPRADDIEPDEGESGKAAARAMLGLAPGDTIVAILPGSRGTEVRLSGADFLAAAQRLDEAVDRFVIPAANKKRYVQLQKMLLDFPGLAAKVLLTEGGSRPAMTAADLVLVNSGTATLEAMLLKKPMVMSYRVSKLTYSIVSRMVTTRWFALPNILAGKQLVPELIQDAATPASLAQAVVDELNNPARAILLAEFDEIHRRLKQGTAPGFKAAGAVLELCNRSS